MYAGVIYSPAACFNRSVTCLFPEQCQKTCKGPWKQCTNKKCTKKIRGYCCKNIPYTSYSMLATYSYAYAYISVTSNTFGFSVNHATPLYNFTTITFKLKRRELKTN